MSIRKEGHIDPRADERLIRQEVEKELARIGMEAERHVLDYLSKHNIDFEGDLAKSVYSEVQLEMQVMRMTFGANAKHAIFVHDGTKPHWAPIAPLRRWVVKKLGYKFPQAEQVARKVQLKIARRGTKAKPFAETTMRLIRRTAPMKIESAIARGVRRAS